MPTKSNDPVTGRPGDLTRFPAAQRSWRHFHAEIRSSTELFFMQERFNQKSRHLASISSLLMHRRSFLFLALCATSAHAAQSTFFGTSIAPAKDPALRAKVDAALEKAFAYLRKQQRPDGAWSSTDYPGLTGLVVRAFVDAPGQKLRDSETVRKGLTFIRSCARPDGGIYTRGLGNYNTSICVGTLILAGDEKDARLVENGSRFLVSAQISNSAFPAHDGGFGYEGANADNGKPRKADLDNTVFSLEALHLARNAAKTKEQPSARDLDWNAAIEFVSRCQNLTATNKQPWASDDPENKGGFVYTPEDKSSDGKTSPDEGKSMRSYGSITYAGLLSFIYADLKKDDQRVQAALDWLAKHYTLEENPGQGKQGLYYYYHMIAKGLTAAGVDELRSDDGKTINWRADLTNKLLTLQKPDGSWSNEVGRFMEKDPVLVTTYCALALNQVYGQL
ncbi:MAG: cycloartenol synthase [Verrucomicrobiaceae bacterium]|nr:MAG: cycloartenol synthase [Verrucomicrobiaceae bacterium]